MHSDRSCLTLKLAPLFQDHAVLQCGQDVPVWGWAAAGENVTVSFKGQSVVTAADKFGCWRARLEPLAASAEPADLTVNGKTTVILLRDILVGEVWLASGQSNMARPLSDVPNADREIARAEHPLIRRFNAINTVADTPAATVAGTWEICRPAVAGGFSGVGYYFARDMQRELGVPVGLIQSTWGGTIIETWMSDEALEPTKASSAIAARWTKRVATHAEKTVTCTEEQAAWARAELQARATQTRNPQPWPDMPVGLRSLDANSSVFNGMVAPLQPVALRGIIWWQGESSATRPDEYRELFPAMIRSWRKSWERDDLPFLFVQLANYLPEGDPTHQTWAWFREAQAQALALPETAMVTAIDLGDPLDIHLQNKEAVGHRLAQLALVKIHGRAGEISGPVFASAVREGSALRVRFTHAAPALSTRDGPVQALELAGDDRVFHPAEGRIEADTLVVTAPLVPAPVAVRYAWCNAPKANLYNQAGLPAVPFRSDAW